MFECLTTNIMKNDKYSYIIYDCIIHNVHNSGIIMLDFDQTFVDM